MDNNKLIEKFLANQSTLEEAHRAINLLEKDEECCDTFLTKAEWDLPAETDLETTSLKNEIWNNILHETAISKKNTMMWRPWLIAACIVFLAVISAVLVFQLADNKTHQNPQLAMLDQRMLTNSTDHIQRYKFPDNSLISLYPNASIVFCSNFQQERSITLSGKANFKVAKDPDHPFKVISGGISTTALGTEFLVNQQGQKINVQLFEGKVLIKSIHNLMTLQDTYLEAGQQFSVDTYTGKFSVQNILSSETTYGPSKIGHRADVKNALLQFRNQSLEEVVNQLSTRFHASIDVAQNDMANKFFTGNFSEHDQLYDILNLIARATNMKLKQEKNRLSLSSIPQDDLQKNSRIQGQSDEDISINHAEGNRESVFAQVPLREVIESLQVLYNTPIDITGVSLTDHYFTGTVSTKDSIEDILLYLCNMNNLNLKSVQGRYQIRPNKK